jgi:hypothetical protein
MPSASEASATVCATAALPAKPFNMPTACEPWPGNRNANLVIGTVCSK